MRHASIVAAIALVALLAACGQYQQDDGTRSAGGTGSTGSTGEPSGTPAAGSTTPEGTPEPGPETSPVDTPAPPVDTRPVVGNVQLSPSNVECSYVPNGNLDGRDGLTVFAYILLIGANSLPGQLSSGVAFSNGHSATYTGRPDNQHAAAFQGPIGSGDWGDRLTVRISADPGDQYRESDESDNTIEVVLDLPANRPTRTVDPVPCTAHRA